MPDILRRLRPKDIPYVLISPQGWCPQVEPNAFPKRLSLSSDGLAASIPYLDLQSAPNSEQRPKIMGIWFMVHSLWYFGGPDSAPST